MVQLYPPKQGDAEDLFNANAPIIVFLTLVGAGTGIYDEWEGFYDRDQLLHGDVYNFLINKLKSFADSSGAGKIEEALMEVEDQAKVSEVKQFIDNHPQAFVEDTVQDTSGRDLFVVVLNDGEKEWTEIIPNDMESAEKLLDNINSQNISRAMKE